jgi:hypothetical protein
LARSSFASSLRECRKARNWQFGSIEFMGKPRRLSFIPTSRAIAPWAAVGLLLLVSLPGCGPKSDRLAISGKVTLNGAPLDLGSIRFSSNGGGKLFASGAVVKDGEYHIPQLKGLPPGTYRVEINSPDTKAPLVTYRPAPGEPVAPPTAPERVPAEYNSESKHSVEVSASKDNEFIFDIVSRPSK